MRIRRVYNSWIPQLLKVGAITLYPFILFSRKQFALSKEDYIRDLFKHEYIHIEQVRRLGWFKFYFLYLVDSAKNGYDENKYEIEAYARQTEPFTDEEQIAYDEDFGK
jgi:hypothetical protein